MAWDGAALGGTGAGTYGLERYVGSKERLASFCYVLIYVVVKDCSSAFTVSASGTLFFAQKIIL